MPSKKLRREYGYDAYDIYDRPMVFDLPKTQLTGSGRRAKRKYKRRGY